MCILALTPTTHRRGRVRQSSLGTVTTNSTNARPPPPSSSAAMADDYREEDRRRPAPTSRSTSTTSGLIQYLRRPSTSQPRPRVSHAHPTTIAASSSSHRQISAPVSPNLTPTTAIATGSFIQPMKASSRNNAQSIATILGFLRPPYHSSITPEILIDNARSLLLLIRNPDTRPPDFASTISPLQSICTARTSSSLRQAGFDLLSGLVELWLDPSHQMPSLHSVDRYRLWGIIRSQWEPPPVRGGKSPDSRDTDALTGDEWDSRFAALSALSNGGKVVEGLTDLPRIVIDWARYFSRSYIEYARSSTPIGPIILEAVERRMSACFVFLTSIFNHNIPTLSDTQVDDFIDAFQSSIKEALLVVPKVEDSSSNRGSCPFLSSLFRSS